MLNCLKTEFKTFFHIRIVAVCLLALLIVTLAFFYNGFQNVKDQIIYDRNTLEEVIQFAKENDDADVDYSAITDSLTEIYKTYNPQMALNNSLGVLLGIAIIVFPIISSCYIGAEYGKSRTIKQKCTYYSLLRIFLSKSVVLVAVITAFTMIYSLICYIITASEWKKINILLSNIGEVAFDGIKSFSLKENAVLFGTVVAVIFFYTLITMLISSVFKGSTFGIIGVVAINYIVLPTEYSPHNVIFAIINKVIYTSSVSPYSFFENGIKYLSIGNAVALFSVYFFVVILALLFVSLRQRNN